MYDMKNLSKLKDLDANAPEAMKPLSRSTRLRSPPVRFRSNTRS